MPLSPAAPTAAALAPRPPAAPKRCDPSDFSFDRPRCRGTRRLRPSAGSAQAGVGIGLALATPAIGKPREGRLDWGVLLADVGLELKKGSGKLAAEVRC